MVLVVWYLFIEGFKFFKFLVMIRYEFGFWVVLIKKLNFFLGWIIKDFIISLLFVVILFLMILYLFEVKIVNFLWFLI